ncbi:hypothetical protein FHR81_005547 [Actinoalloteichus hoggarensis]|uniref:TfuA-like protein n=1 Tax=Actinoalloteichus hoggarensis TaxID=1470176 RepID=A0A221W4B1_9PSEU|nr:TfuA-like protein [Actinoalloteichus hoggarensis]ASO20685.1 TfuA-like protein [Actinoalloteichus hoggarensis]MBB5924462.1 hypothetical protein [Actinoalloteichus hoggarensis]
MVLHVFSGPTLDAEEIRRRAPGCVVHGPVGHGDLLRLGVGDGDVVLVLDGYFFQAPAVRHKEMLELVRCGVRVIGASSMGALRAAELRGLGVTGVGQVYRWYADDVVTADDEVAVSHLAAEDGYRAVSTPLVAVRYALDRAVAAEAVSQEAAEGLLESMRAIPFPRRSWTSLWRSAEDSGLAEAASRLRAHLAARPADADVKRLDALSALDLAVSIVPTVPELPDHTARTLETVYLADWRWESRGAAVGGRMVPDRLASAFLQLFLPVYPRIHRHTALTAVAADQQAPGSETAALGTGPSHQDGDRPTPPSSSGLASGDTVALEEAALAAARARGLVGPREEPLTAELRQWCSPAELASHDLDQREAALRGLVRSYRVGPGVRVGHEFPAMVRDAPGLLHLARTAAAAALRLTEAKRSRDPEFQLEHLRADVIDEFFRERWGGELECQAWDRGLTGVAELRELGREFLFLARAGLIPESALAAVRLTREKD